VANNDLMKPENGYIYIFGFCYYSITKQNFSYLRHDAADNSCLSQGTRSRLSQREKDAFEEGGRLMYKCMK
jgi:hypothetical protein